MLEQHSFFKKEHLKTQVVVYVLHKNAEFGDFMLVYNARALPFYVPCSVAVVASVFC